MGTIQVTPGESGRLVVHFPYSTERVAVIRTVPGRRWHAKEKYWTVPHTPETLERVCKLFMSDRVVVAAAVEAAPAELSVEQIREIVTALDEELALRDYSVRTRDNYRLQAQRFLKWLQRDPTTATHIRVRGGKGKKDRYTILADRTLSLLRTYYRSYRPGKWLFPGQDPGRHMSRSSAQRIFERA